MDIQVLGKVDLSIEAWQMGLLAGLMGVLFLMRRPHLSLSVTCLFILYWGFILHWPSFVAAAGSDTLVLALYFVCGVVIIVLAILALLF